MSHSAPTTVAVARFEDLLSRGLRALIDDDPSLTLVASDFEHDRLAVILRAHRPQVALISFGDLRTPVEIRDLSAQNPDTNFVVLANNPGPAECAQLLAFGAAACLAKATQARDILNAIHLASRGLQLIPRAIHDRDGATPAGSELLTQRESEVLALLQRNRSNAQIAAELHIGIETVRTHASNIYRKLGVSSRRELLAPPPRAAASNPRRPTPRRRVSPHA